MAFLFKGGVPTDRTLKEVNVYNKNTFESSELLYETFTPREIKLSYVKDFVLLFIGLSVIFALLSGNSDNLSVKTLLSYMSNNRFFFDRFISDIAELKSIKTDIEFLINNPINFDVNFTPADPLGIITNLVSDLVNGFHLFLLYIKRFFTFFDVILGFILNGIATVINLISLFLNFVGF